MVKPPQTGDLQRLRTLFDQHTGKVSDKWTSYLTVYEEILAPFSNKPVRVLEIGIQNGGSLEIWAKYFEHADLILGCDVDPQCKKLVFDHQNVEVVVGNANEQEVARSIARISDSFDVIIDDGSHNSVDVITSFSIYFPMLRPDGVYIVEDLHCSYWKDWRGGLHAPYSSMSLFKCLADVVNHEHWGSPAPAQLALQYFREEYSLRFDEASLLNIKAVSFWNSICAIWKNSGSDRGLGSRIIAGRTASVAASPIEYRETVSVAPDESKNPWGPNLESSEKLVIQAMERSLLRDELVKTRRELTAASKTIRSLEDKVGNLGSALRRLRRDPNSQALLTREIQDLIQSATKILRRPVRSYLATRLARRALKIPGLSNRHRSRLMNASKSWDPRGAANVLLEKSQRLLLEEARQPITSSKFPQSWMSSTENQNLDLTGRSESVDIILYAHSSLDELRTCLSSLVEKTTPPYNLIIVDDACGAECEPYLEAFQEAQSALLFRNRSATGYIRSVNLGLRASSANWIIVLESNAIVSSGWLDELLKIGISDPAIGMLGPSSNRAKWQSVPEAIPVSGVWPKNPLPPGISIDEMQSMVSSQAPPCGIDMSVLDGFALSIRREVIDEVGAFNESSLGADRSSVDDYCTRVRRAGWKLVLAGNAYVFTSGSKYSERSNSHTTNGTEIQIGSASKEAGKSDNPPGFERMSDLALAAFRARVAEGLRCYPRAVHHESDYCGKRLAFVLPANGDRYVAEFLSSQCRELREFNVDTWLISLGRHRAFMAASYPELTGSALYFETVEDITAYLGENPIGFDGIVVTSWLSLSWLPSVSERSSVKFGIYALSSADPDPNSGDKQHKATSGSRQQSEGLRFFGETGLIEKQFAHLPIESSTVIGPSIDLDQFRPKSRDLMVRERMTLVTVVRPDFEIERQNSNLTSNVLNRLSEEFSNSLDILVVASATDGEVAMNLCSSIATVSPVDGSELAFLLQNSDIFLYCGSSRCSGARAFEAMACGLAVVISQEDDAAELTRHKENAMVVKTKNEDAYIEAVRELIESEVLRNEIRLAAALDMTAYSCRKAAINLIDGLFGESS